MRVDALPALNARQMLQSAALRLPTEALSLRLAEQTMRGAGQMAPADAPPAAPSGAGPANPLGSVQMLVTLAALGPADEQRREAVAQARKGLDSLERLHRQLLSGRASRRTLDELRQWLEAKPASDDPKLAEFFNDLELRVRVELAKFEL